MTEKLTDFERQELGPNGPSADVITKLLRIHDAQAATLKLVRAAIDAAGNRWSEWGDRAEMVREMLDAALSPALAQACKGAGCPRDGECPEHGRNRPGQCVSPSAGDG
jgi:hypothetical protein